MKTTKTLQSYDTPQEAYLIAGMLKNNGIHAIVEDLNNVYVPVFYGVNVVVYADDYEKARQLLKEHGDVLPPK